ncbi:hypothetical protein CFOL_v3_19416, partial [Cephalotus follicularis]
NRTLQEIARTMLCKNSLPKYFWAEAVNTACWVLNRITIRPILKKTLYELWRGRKPNISYFHTFRCRCFVHNNDKENLGKFDVKADEGIFLGYSNSSKAYRIFNKKRLVVKESMHVIFDESNLILPRQKYDDDDIGILQEKVNEMTLIDSHSLFTIIGNPTRGITTRSSSNACNYLAFLSQIKPKNIRLQMMNMGLLLCKKS